jgi:hypothetical protein
MLTITLPLKRRMNSAKAERGPKQKGTKQKEQKGRTHEISTYNHFNYFAVRLCTGLVAHSANPHSILGTGLNDSGNRRK